jgi:hypothetical protein
MGRWGIAGIALAAALALLPAATRAGEPYIMTDEDMERYGRGPAAFAPTGEEAARYQLRLVASGGRREWENAVVEGRVRNVSDRPIENLSVVVTYYRADESVLTSVSAPIDTPTLKPGAEASFKTTAPHDPRMAKFTVSFADAGGSPVPHTR